jgi:hypothetical protein
VLSPKRGGKVICHQGWLFFDCDKNITTNEWLAEELKKGK